MTIPNFDGQYYLPPGEHSCTLSEVEERFGKLNEQRKKVWQSFMRMLDRKRELGLIPEEIIINGSFCTQRECPGDVDAAILVRPEVALSAYDNGDEHEKRAIQLMIQAVSPGGEGAQRILRDLFGAHILLADSEQSLSNWAAFFKQTKDPDPSKDPAWVTKPAEKGILRVDGRGDVGHAERTDECS